VLAQQAVQPSDRPLQVALTDKVKVTIPAGAVTKACQLTLTESPDPPGPPQGGLTALASYHVSLGDQHEFDEPIVIEIPYDPAVLPPGQLELLFLASEFRC
jgi:hypothetical protein